MTVHFLNTVCLALSVASTGVKMFIAAVAWSWQSRSQTSVPWNSSYSHQLLPFTTYMYNVCLIRLHTNPENSFLQACNGDGTKTSHNRYIWRNIRATLSDGFEKMAETALDTLHIFETHDQKGSNWCSAYRHIVSSLYLQSTLSKQQQLLQHIQAHCS